MNTDLETQILTHWGLYLVGVSEVSDQEFDLLVERLRRENPTSPALRHLGPAGEVEHLRPMLSLAKVKSEAEIEKWVKGLPLIRHSGASPRLIVMPKLDGLAVALRYDGRRLVRATTRGDGKKGEDVTRHLRRMSVPKELELDGEVRGEVVLRRDRLAGLGKTCRNVAAGILGREDAKDSHLLDFVAWGVAGDNVLTGSLFSPAETLRWLREQHFNVVPAVEYTYERAVAMARNADDASPKGERSSLVVYDHDGAVIAVDDYAVREKMGEGDHHPRWAVALKLRTAEAETRVLWVDWQVGRTGVVTPVLVVEDVEVDGVTVGRVTGHNVATLQEKKIGPDAVVVLTRRGGVIPHVESVTRSAPVVYVPVVCPQCGQNLQREGRDLRHDPVRCPAAKWAALEYLLKAIDVDGFGEATLKDLNATTLAELFVRPMPMHLLRALEVRKHAPIPLAKALEAVGYPLANRLAMVFATWRAVPAASNDVLLGIEGVGTGVLAKIRAVDPEPLFYLEENGFVIAEGFASFPKRYGEAVAKDAAQAVFDILQPLSNMVFCFTGELTKMSRSSAQDLVRSLGGEATSSVTKKTTHLVATAEGSEKHRKAKEKGIVIMDENAFLALVGPIDVKKVAVDIGARK